MTMDGKPSKYHVDSSVLFDGKDEWGFLRLSGFPGLDNVLWFRANSDFTFTLIAKERMPEEWERLNKAWEDARELKL